MCNNYAQASTDFGLHCNGVEDKPEQHGTISLSIMTRYSFHFNPDNRKHVGESTGPSESRPNWQNENGNQTERGSEGAQQGREALTVIHSPKWEECWVVTLIPWKMLLLLHHFLLNFYWWDSSELWLHAREERFTAMLRKLERNYWTETKMFTFLCISRFLLFFFCFFTNTCIF